MKKMSKVSRLGLNIFKVVPFVIIALLTWLYIQKGGNLRAEDILQYTPDSIALAAVILIGFYAVKSLSIVFPLLVLYISAGVMFPAPLAIIINIAGLFLCVSIPYGIGRFSGKDLLDHLTKKYKKISQLDELQHNNAFFFSFFLRVINLLPGDIVSMVLGASGIPYWRYVIGTILGLFPTMLAATFLGESILEPFSPVFLISAVSTVLISVISFVVWRVMKKRLSSKK